MHRAVPDERDGPEPVLHLAYVGHAVAPYRRMAHHRLHDAELVERGHPRRGGPRELLGEVVVIAQHAAPGEHREQQLVALVPEQPQGEMRAEREAQNDWRMLSRTVRTDGKSTSTSSARHSAMQIDSSSPEMSG